MLVANSLTAAACRLEIAKLKSIYSKSCQPIWGTKMPDTNVNQKKILNYLKKGVTRGKYFFKSKAIARELGLSPNEVGTNISMLIDNSEDIVIEKWSYSHGTTWRVYNAKEA